MSGAPVAPEGFQTNVGELPRAAGAQGTVVGLGRSLEGASARSGRVVMARVRRHGMGAHTPCIRPYLHAPFSVRRPGDVSTGDVCRCPSAPPLFGDGAWNLGRPRRPLPPDTFLYVDVAWVTR